MSKSFFAPMQLFLTSSFDLIICLQRFDIVGSHATAWIEWGIGIGVFYRSSVGQCAGPQQNLDINDGFFLNNPSTVAGAWGDGPAAYHNGAAGLSFADGHSEIHKWRQPLLKVVFSWSPPAFDAGGRADYQWLMERTAVPYPNN